MTNKMGFNFAQSNETLKEEIDDVQHIEAILKDELIEVSKVKSNLTIELREVEDLENNFKVLQEQFHMIEQLIGSQHELTEKIIYEAQKEPSKVDLEKTKKYYTLIGTLTEKLKPLIALLATHLNRLFLTETHPLYLEIEKNRKMMHDLDEQARVLYAKLTMMSQHVDLNQKTINELGDQFQQLTRERKAREEKKDPIGYINNAV